MSVRLGEHNTETDIDCLDNGFGGQECAPAPINIPIEEQIAHEDYVPTNPNQYHDIALLRLARNVPFSGTLLIHAAFQQNISMNVNICFFRLH